MPQPYRSQVLDHLGLVAGMFDELGIGAVIDHATRQTPETRLVTVGNAVKAMVLNGLGCVHQQRSLVPLFCQHKPTHRLIAPEIEAPPLNDDTLGRALDTLYDYGVTERYGLVAATAVQRLGLISRFAHLDSTSFHVDGRYHRAEEPDAHVIHITRGDSRDHRPDLNQVMLDLLVEHQAGIPLLMQPLSGTTSDAHDVGDVVTAHIAQLHTTDGTSYLVADSALYREETLAKLAHTGSRWITRVPATLTEAPHALVQAPPATMIALRASYRYQVLASTYGGVAQRWRLIYSEPRRPQAPRTVDKQLLTQGSAAVKAVQKLCRTTFAGAVDAQQALNTFAHSLRATAVLAVTVRATPRYHKRGRPGRGTSPAQVGYQLEGALASSIAAREALVAQQSCFILATNELDDTQLSAQAVLEGYKGQKHAERGFRCLKHPRFLASTLALKQPERLMALLMVMTVCLLVYAALAYRIRQTLRDHEAPFPNQRGQPIHHPTTRWVFQDFGGIHLRIRPGEGPLVLNLNETHEHLLRLLGRPYKAFYSYK